MRARRLLPSPAIVVAGVALILAVGGTAYAEVEGGWTKANQAADQKSDANQAAGVVHQLASHLHVQFASSAGSANTANSANSAKTANTAKTADTAKTATTATNANTANTANSANTANTANDATKLGGKPASAYELAGYEQHWGNVLIAKGGSDVVVAKAGPFTLTARCTTASSGQAEYLLTSSVSAFVSSEDGPYAMALAANTPTVVTNDPDYDEAVMAWAPSTGTSIHAYPFNFPVTYSSTSFGTKCEFHGAMYKDS